MTTCIHGYININGQSIYTTQHYLEKSVSGVTIVAQPVGPEYMHCRASVRKLAKSLSDEGQMVVTFDWPGYGQSSGRLPDDCDTAVYSEVLKGIARHFKTEDIPTSLVSLRSASLLLNDVLLSEPIEQLVLWYPLTQGKAFIRDLMVIDDALGVSGTEYYIEGGGYPIFRSKLAGFEERSMKSLNFTQCQSALVIHTPETKRLNFLKDLEQTVPATTCIASNEAKTMIRQAELSTAPESDITQICEVFTRFNPKLDISTDVTLSFEAHHFSEQPVHFGESNCFGVLTRPSTDHTQCLVIPNTGSGHCVGPNGLHRDLARLLAAKGIAVLRFDLRHLGESGNIEDNSSEAYSDDAKRDLASAIGWLEREYSFSSISLFGICSGAFTVFSYLSTPDIGDNVDQGFLVNANALSWQKGHNPFVPETALTAIEENYHASQAKSLSAWIKLLTSPEKWGRIFISGLQILRRKLVQKISNHQLTVLEKNCEQALKKADKLTFVFSPDDIGVKTVGDQCKEKFFELTHAKKIAWQVLESGDHTFTKVEDRNSLIDTILSNLLKAR